MSIYTPAHFSIDDHAAIAALIDAFPFATLVTPQADEPAISHLPLLRRDAAGTDAALIGHCARANSHWQVAQGIESIAIFHGPHAYVSPSWYTEPAKAVPTWNYATVHVHGVLEPITGAAETRDVLDALVRRFEGSRDAPWTFSMPERARDAMIGAIVAFRIRVLRVDAKFKLSQNRSRNDREGTIAGLAAEPYADSHALADWMRRYAFKDGRDDDAAGG
jgi:transcriptional regulator